MIQKKDLWPSRQLWVWEEVQGGEEWGWPAHFYSMPNPWGRFAKGQGQLPNRAKCPVFFLFTGDDLSWYGLNFQSSLLSNCLPDGGDSPPSTLRRNRSPRKLGQNTRERKKKTRVYIWQVPDDVYLPSCYTAEFRWILSCNNQTGIQTHFLWMELGFWVLLFLFCLFW